MMYNIWGRPLDVSEVNKLWGNGMGDLGPNARIEVDSIAWSNQISGRLVLNQPVNDFNASQDIVLGGLSLSSISEEISSSGTIYNLILTPDSFTPNTLSITLAANSITDAQGVTNAEVTETIDFRPHRVRESDLLVWWELNSSNLTGGSDPSSIAGLQVWFDANDSSTLTYDTSNVVSEWKDRSGNSRDATHQFGQPVFSSIGGPGGMPALEFSRSGGNDALSIGGSAFFLQRINFMSSEVWVSPLISLVEYWGILPPIQIQGVLIIFFKTGELTFIVINTRPLFSKTELV